MRLRELAASRVRFGYRRLTVLLKREGWAVNAKRIYRLYSEERDSRCAPSNARRPQATSACHRAWPQHRTTAGAWTL